ncbi:FAD-binding and (Fe-S)-binding domain-containing protein [uncultured Jannaschia sp.]|uniref:FAD-binding and (Fe-S)-binding domain-containing protein n=1 Tax=uncultured Jannaschia sp. TaxID=293347 RepID=UPI002626E4E9|nr:FAD-binding and (Fe-S)-binding domain-containing protein [uncultured Jannaschia sp.]
MADWQRLRTAIEGDVLTDAFDRGRYATDASFYQIVPQAVVLPRRFDDVAATLAFARESGVPVTGRGGGTSQAGQTVNSGIVIDYSRHLNAVCDLDVEEKRATVEPGLVLDSLNRTLKSHELWFPVDVSTASRATIGGMAANNSCGGRSIRYGRMRENVVAIDAMLACGTRARFGEVDRAAAMAGTGDPVGGLVRDMLALGAREAEEIAARFPKVMRRVGGYNIDALVPDGPTNNLAHLLVGSEGTLALTEQVELVLSPLPRHKSVGVCHFPTFRDAMAATQHIVALGPDAVELVDRTMIALGRKIPALSPSLDEFVRGDPAALLLVEFAGDDVKANAERLASLHDLMADLGFRWGSRQEGGVLDAAEQPLQAKITEVRTQGLNIMMSMRSEGKPVSFVEDCAVPLEDLPDFTDRLTALFARHGTDGTWYAHASVGLLHVRPILNLRQDKDVHALRAIAEEAFDIVAEYKGSHSGEHGDGIVRSEFHERMFGARMVRAFGEVKDRFDPDGVLNPGKIVRAPKMDDRSLFRYPPAYARDPVTTRFDWGEWPAGLHGAVEMCNNNGACRKLTGGAMCPSYRVTREERDLTRGRANTLRLALSGQLGPDALTSDEMAETLKLCVSCKACKRECPMSVDMAAMKVEVTAARVAKDGLSLRDRLVAHLPRYAPVAAKAPWLANARDALPGAAWLSERVAGLAAGRSLPRWNRDPFVAPPFDDDAPEVILFADTFNRWFEPDHLRDAVAVLRAAGLRVGHARASSARPLCCGRTYLSAGLVEEARAEMVRTVAALRPALDRGAFVVGLEPSCLLTFRDEAPRLLPDWSAEDGARVQLLEEFLADRVDRLPLRSLPGRAWLHGHCHQKAANVMGPVTRVLEAVPDLEVRLIDSSCCGMAGAFGYQAETAEVSRAMGELTLLPAVRAAGPEDWIVADGTSCRHQIADGTGRRPVHAATLLRAACGEPVS